MEFRRLPIFDDMKYLFWFAFTLIILSKTAAQSSFFEQQLDFPKVKKAYQLHKDSLEAQYHRAQLAWPQKKYILEVLSTTVN